MFSSQDKWCMKVHECSNNTVVHVVNVKQNKAKQKKGDRAC